MPPDGLPAGLPNCSGFLALSTRGLVRCILDAMIFTVEVRWFARGKIPSNMSLWFEKVPGNSEPQPTRSDSYLMLPDNDSLGVKLREGRLELKQRQKKLGRFTWQDRVNGQVESWIKWGFPLASGAQSLQPASPALWKWAVVSKTRVLKHFQAEVSGLVTAVSPATFLTTGCHLELARVSIQDQIWWTIGLEAFGAADFQKLAGLLDQVAELVFVGEMELGLETAVSCSYPQWLQQFYAG